MQRYLRSTDIIDWEHPEVAALAAGLARGVSDRLELVRACFEWVRDEVRHSWDYRQNPVTCRASEVLKHRTGYCYAKSHLLAALLRANGVPTGLCYQRLSVEDSGAPYCLHGLNAVYLEGYGWYRVDPRGNKEGVDAQFTPPVERLAFKLVEPQEIDLPEIWADPLACVVEVLQRCASVEEVRRNLPDVDLVPSLL